MPDLEGSNEPLRLAAALDPTDGIALWEDADPAPNIDHHTTLAELRQWLRASEFVVRGSVVSGTTINFSFTPELGFNYVFDGYCFAPAGGNTGLVFNLDHGAGFLSNIFYYAALGTDGSISQGVNDVGDGLGFLSWFNVTNEATRFRALFENLGDPANATFWECFSKGRFASGSAQAQTSGRAAPVAAATAIRFARTGGTFVDVTAAFNVYRYPVEAV